MILVLMFDTLAFNLQHKNYLYTKITIPIILNFGIKELDIIYELITFDKKSLLKQMP